MASHRDDRPGFDSGDPMTVWIPLPEALGFHFLADGRSGAERSRPPPWKGLRDVWAGRRRRSD